MAGIGSGGWRSALGALRRAGFGGETVLVGAIGPVPDEGLRLRLIESPPAASPQSRRALGIAAAESDLIASLSEDYHVDASWVQAALAVTAAVAWGPVDPPSGAGYFERAAWLWEYSHLPNAGPAWIPAGNVVYQREALPPGLLARAASEMEAHARLADAGLRFDRLESLRAVYQPPGLAGFLADRRRWSRQGSRGRASPWRALALTPVLLWRQLRRLGTLPFAPALPAFLLFALAQTLGELDAVFSRMEDN